MVLCSSLRYRSAMINVEYKEKEKGNLKFRVEFYISAANFPKSLKESQTESAEHLAPPAKIFKSNHALRSFP